MGDSEALEVVGVHQECWPEACEILLREHEGVGACLPLSFHNMAWETESISKKRR